MVLVWNASFLLSSLSDDRPIHEQESVSILDHEENARSLIPQPHARNSVTRNLSFQFPLGRVWMQMQFINDFMRTKRRRRCRRQQGDRQNMRTMYRRQQCAQCVQIDRPISAQWGNRRSAAAAKQTKSFEYDFSSFYFMIEEIYDIHL